MTNIDEVIRYSEWLKSLARSWIDLPGSFNSLVTHLDARIFVAGVERDENRITDAIFFRDEYYEGASSDLVEKPISVLEVLMALASRCCDNIIGEPDEFNYGKIFTDMLINLGLLRFDDGSYSNEEVDVIIDNFLNRNFGKHGEGSIVYLQEPRHNPKKVDLWYLMMWYITENY